MTTALPTKVMIVDDHEIMRDGLMAVLGQANDLEVVAQAADGEQAVRVALEVEPDVVIMDIFLPGKDGIDACREIMEALPQTRVLVLTAATETDAVIDAVAAGATGYLQKYTGRNHLLATIRNVARGEYSIPSQLTSQVFAGIRAKAYQGRTRDATRLTAGEREILTLFAQGMSYAEIADSRGNRPLTIRNTIYRIQVKLGIKTKQQIVLWAVRNGLLDGAIAT